MDAVNFHGEAMTQPRAKGLPMTFRNGHNLGAITATSLLAMSSLVEIRN